MIKFSNGHAFEYMSASGALGFDGKGWFWEQPLKLFGLFDLKLFTSVTKTLTLYPRKGNLRWYNPFRCLRFIDGGVVNAVDLSNPGIDWWRRKIGPSVDSKKIPLIISISGEPKELVEMAKILNDFDLVGLEINISCPNIKTGILQDGARVFASCEAVKINSRLPLILKVSAAQNISRIAREVESIVEAFSINSVSWQIVFPEKRSPLAHFGGGGVSGKAVQPFTWNLVKEITKLTSVPVIGPSVWDYKDIEKLRMIGASAISFGSIFLRYPWRPTIFIRKDKKKRTSNARTGCFGNS